MDVGLAVDCKARMNSLYMIMGEYAVDHDNHYPPSFNGYLSPDVEKVQANRLYVDYSYGHWGVQLHNEGYATHEQQDEDLNCRANPYNSISPSHLSKTLYSSRVGSHYLGSKSPDPLREYVKHSASEIYNPQSMVMFTDSTNVFNQNRTDYFVTENNCMSTATKKSHIGFELHMQGANFVFVDGHHDQLFEVEISKDWFRYRPK